MKNLLFLPILALSISGLQAQSIISGVETFDPVDEAFDIDTVLNGSTFASASAFRNLMSDLWAADAGGVINFENGVSSDGDTDFTFNYGANSTGTLTFTTSALLGADSGKGEEVSGTQRGSLKNGDFASSDPPTSTTFTFGESIAIFGLALTETRNLEESLEIQLTFDDSTTVTSAIFTPDDYTEAGLFAYQADEDNKIQSVTLNQTSFFGFDDVALATTVIPEPSSLSLLLVALGVGACLRRRRRA